MKERLICINSLKQQLLDLGYHPFQVDSIIKDSIHTNNLNAITPKMADQLVEDLNEHIQFAIKCKRGNKK